LSKDGYAGWRSKFDDRDNKIEFAYFGADGKPVLSKDGYAGSRSKFDERGNKIETAYFDTKNIIIEGVDGVAIIVRDFDTGGREIMRRLLNKSGTLTKAKASGRSIIRTDYDHRHLKVKEALFDDFDRPVNRLDEHWSIKEWYYDASGQTTKVVARDKAGKILP
jgi:YD repeat-containing protein